MSKFSEIYRFVSKRKKVLNKLHKAQREVEKYETEIKEIEKPFYECEINLEKYRDFFKKYYISFGSGSKYIVKKIELTKDYENKPFYEITYMFEGNGEKNEGNMSLRKFFHLLDYADAKFERIGE